MTDVNELKYSIDCIDNHFKNNYEVLKNKVSEDEALRVCGPYLSKTSKIKQLLEDYQCCINELCLQCGKYKNEHLGACDGCKWKRSKNE